MTRRSGRFIFRGKFRFVVVIDNDANKYENTAALSRATAGISETNNSAEFGIKKKKTDVYARYNPRVTAPSPGIYTGTAISFAFDDQPGDNPRDPLNDLPNYVQLFTNLADSLNREKPIRRAIKARARFRFARKQYIMLYVILNVYIYTR